MTLNNCAHSDTPVAIIAAAPKTTLTCTNSTVTDCGQAVLAIGKASATFQNLEVSGTFTGAAIEARGCGTKMTVDNAQIRGLPAKRKDSSITPKPSNTLKNPTDGALARCGAHMTVSDSTIERVAIGVRATNPQTVLNVTNTDVRTVRIALAHAADGARIHAVGSNFESTAIGGAGVVATGDNTVASLKQCLINDTYNATVTIANGGAGILADCTLASSRSTVGVFHLMIVGFLHFLHFLFVKY